MIAYLCIILCQLHIDVKDALLRGPGALQVPPTSGRIYRLPNIPVLLSKYLNLFGSTIRCLHS